MTRTIEQGLRWPMPGTIEEQGEGFSQRSGTIRRE
jgi:hypothetical protein